MLGLRRSRHPTPAQAYEALSQASCLYALVSECNGKPSAVGLRHALDGSDVLVCPAHIGQLRSLRGRELDDLEHYVRRQFGR